MVKTLTLLMYWPKFKSLPNTVVKLDSDQNSKPKVVKVGQQDQIARLTKGKETERHHRFSFGLTMPSLSLVKKVISGASKAKRIIRYQSSERRSC
jgi:hypothetical protein